MQEDIIEKEQEASKEPKKVPKPPKEPKIPKAKPEKPAKAAVKKPVTKSAGHKAGKSSGGAIACIFLVVLVLAGAMIVYFNVGGSAEAVVAILKDNIQADEEVYEGPSAEELEKKQAELNKLEQTLEKRKKNIDRKEDDVSAQEKDLSEREKTLTQQLEDFKTESEKVYALAQAQAELKATAQVFEKMDVQKAADAISKLKPVSRIADLFKAMNEEKAAQILDKMSSKLATSVLSAMMK